jgi:hypothetical protein
VRCGTSISFCFDHTVGFIFHHHGGAGGATLIFETELIAVNGNTGKSGSADSEL